MTELTLEQIDLDGAIREALDNVSGDTRAAFLRKSVIAGGGLVGGGIALAAFPREARAATKGDVAILNFALTLEFLEASFYYYSVILGALSGPAKTMARVIYQHEQAHVNFLRKALGSAAVKKPKFNFQGTVEDQDLFLSTAQLLEDTGVGAYAGAAPLREGRRHPGGGRLGALRRGTARRMGPAHAGQPARTGGLRQADQGRRRPGRGAQHEVHRRLLARSTYAA
jgi:hypothetical protein